MRVTPIYSEVIVRKENADALATLLDKIAYPAGSPAPLPLVLDIALYAEERLAAEGIEPEDRVGCTCWFCDERSEEDTAEVSFVPYVGIERIEDGWALYQAGHTGIREGAARIFAFGLSAGASLARQAA